MTDRPPSPRAPPSGELPERQETDAPPDRGTSRTPAWLESVRRLQAIAQTGLTYARDPFDLERYEAVRETAVRLLAELSRSEPEVVERLFAGDRGYATPKVDVRAVVFEGDALLFIRCEITGGSPRESVETSEVGFFRREELPELSRTRVMPDQIIRMFEHRQNPDWPTELD